MTLLTEHLPLLAAAPDGIKKLRELILELAVRGKLVPQDARDEPASELLERIVEEKARLVTEGKIKKSKFAESETAEVSYPIPSTWIAAQLGQVVEIVRGITFPSSEKSKSPERGRVACLRTSNVQNEIEWEDLLYIRENFVSRPDQYVQPHDIVMSMANSRELVGKVALIGPKLDQATTFGGFLGVLRPVLIEPKFVMALLRTPNARSALIDSASQTTNIANVSLAKLRPLPFAIPPLAEQRRIVTKVDELMSLCDTLEAQQANAESAHAQLIQALLDSLTQANDADDFAASWQRLSEHFDTLFTTEASIDAIKQTVLQLAVMGKLVPQETSDAATLKVQKNCETKGAGEEASTQLGAVVSDQAPFELPAGWIWKTLGDLAELINGDRGKNYPNRAEYVSEGIPWINTGHIEPDGKLTQRDMYFITSAKFKTLNNGKIKKGDLVYCLRGATLGKTAIVDRYEVGAIASSLVIIRVSNACLNRYAYYYLVGPVGRRQIFKFDNGSAQPNLSAASVAKYIFPLPPLSEQHRIVAKVDQLMLLCDQLKSHIRQARYLNQQLASTLVERAVA